MGKRASSNNGAILPTQTYSPAETLLNANRPLEQASLAQLSPEQHAQYDAIQAACLQDNDPRAALALQGLLLENKLTGGVPSTTGSHLLQELATLADPQTPLVPGVDRLALLTDMTKELITPSVIAQGGRGTCSTTTFAIDMALTRPAEYARIMGGLASPAGTVTLVSGLTLTREPGTETEDGSGRATSQRLMSSAFSELANPNLEYDNATGANSGAGLEDQLFLMKALFGVEGEGSEMDSNNPADCAATLERIKLHLNEGSNLQVALEFQDDVNATDKSFHQVLVTDTETDNGKDYIHYINPWGQEERMEESEFVQRLCFATYPRKFSTLESVVRDVSGLTGLQAGLRDGFDKVSDFVEQRLEEPA